MTLRRWPPSHGHDPDRQPVGVVHVGGPLTPWWITNPGFRPWWITHPDYLPWKIDAKERLSLCNSYERPMVLSWELKAETDPHARLAMFLSYRSRCDAPWSWRSHIAEALRHALRLVTLAEVLGSDEWEWFRALPDEIIVYRGCERGRERGLSWTTEIEVALKFAQGRRYINRIPTLMSAIIPKQHVFGVFLARNESEVAVDPRRLRRFSRHPSYVSKVEAA
jgi:hypothetical protein